MKLVYISVWSAVRFQSFNGRIGKPFNSLLGETYELVTPTYRAVSEAVSHHPPVTALNCQGEGYTLNKLTHPILKFTGKQL